MEPLERPPAARSPLRGGRSVAYALPFLVVVLWAVWPLVTGEETLYLRDLLNTHLEMKWAEAEALRGGELPLVDPYRAGGQPLLGNLNAVPLYPDNLLYLVAPLLWAFNAHLWLHLLVAPVAMYALARAWGVARQGAWAAGVCYGVSGYLVSNLTFYNLVAGAALAPALAAAFLRLEEGRRPHRRIAAAALVWTLLLLAGDPLLAVQGLALAASALLVRHRLASSRWRAAGLALAVGSLLAAPQLVELARILPLSFRGHWGYAPGSGTVASWDPRQAAEWLLPFLFGRPDLVGPGRFWGHRFFTGVPPYYFSLYPGLLTLGLLAAAGLGRRRSARRAGNGDALEVGSRTARRGWRRTALRAGHRTVLRAWHWPALRAGNMPPSSAWSWAAVAIGIFLALGRFNPLVAWLFELPGGRLLRYPVKFWLPVAVGAALLCGRGFQAAVVEEEGVARRRLRWTLLVLAGLYAAGWLALTFLPAAAEAWITGVLPAGLPPGFAANERIRWAGLCLLSLLALAALGAGLLLASRWRVAGGSLLLALHGAVQLLLLQPTLATDETAPYRSPPALASRLSAEGALVHGHFPQDLFGPGTLATGHYPDHRLLWLERRAFAELYPFVGPLWGFRYELNVSPEGLDTFLTRMAAAAVEQRGSDVERIRLLAAWGVEHLLLNRVVEPAAQELVRLVAAEETFGQPLFVYRIPGRAPPAQVVGEVLRAPHLNAAVALLAGPEFDPRSQVVLPGGGPPARGSGGAARVREWRRESLEVELESAGPAVLLIQRAHLPIYRAAVDGREAPVLPGNLHRVAVEVPGGRHRVRVWVDRNPLRWSLAAAGAGLLALLALALGPRRRRGEGASGGSSPAPAKPVGRGLV